MRVVETRFMIRLISMVKKIGCCAGTAIGNYSVTRCLLVLKTLLTPENKYRYLRKDSMDQIKMVLAVIVIELAFIIGILLGQIVYG